MAKGAVDLDDRVMVFSLLPTCACLCVMVKQINFNLPKSLDQPVRLFPYSEEPLAGTNR